MRPQELLRVLSKAASLKTTSRHCYTSEGRTESVADHSWRIALNMDRDRVIRMCLIHDLGEAFTGDIPTFEKTDADAQTEDGLFEKWVDVFPSPQREEWKALLLEMGQMESREAKTYKALDKLEAVISHNESELSTWLPLEYELQLTYGKENVQFSEYLKELSRCIDEQTREKIAKEGV